MNTIKLIAAGAVALTAISAVHAEIPEPGVMAGNTGSQSFVGTMTVTPGKYINISTVTHNGSLAVSATFNPVAFTGTIVNQNTNASALNVSSTVSKVTNASILAEIYGKDSKGKSLAPKGATLIWAVEGSDQFVDGFLAVLVTTKTGSSTTTTITEVDSAYFSSATLGANLVVSKKSTVTKGTGSKATTTTTTTYSAGVAGIDILDILDNTGVGTITEVDVTGGTPELKITVTLPLSGTELQ